MEDGSQPRRGRPPGSVNFPLVLPQEPTPRRQEHISSSATAPSSPPPAPPAPLAPPAPAKTSPAANPKTPGSSSRPDLYLLGRPKHDSLDMVKLPKVKQILQRYYELAKQEDVVKSLRPKETCARKVIEEVKDVWRHHFGMRLIVYARSKRYILEVDSGWQEVYCMTGCIFFMAQHNCSLRLR